MTAVTEFQVMQLSDLASRNPLYRNAYENAVTQFQIQNQVQMQMQMQTQMEHLAVAPSAPIFDSVEEALARFIEEDHAVQDLVTEDLRHKLWTQGIREGLDVDAAADRALIAMHDPAFESLLRSTSILSQKMRDNMPLSPQIVCDWVSDWCNQAERFPREWIACLTCDKYPSRKGFVLCDHCIMHCVPVPTMRAM